MRCPTRSVAHSSRCRWGPLRSPLGLPMARLLYPAARSTLQACLIGRQLGSLLGRGGEYRTKAWFPGVTT
ncbi:hypothetical protein NDU88_005395 [Pleurodeles waltl]|uniref:Uncharacterized protein n=1 Tax=Pleurodeles waltl TaxID=8319 RepID=A0AAV7PGR4_PLEWA|nr:hypothetical protein NDU88_005395 [Pleurodeles waltl]